MVHVWPTKRDRRTRGLALEQFKLGDPKLVHVGFGEALVLRADVCHGGCFGSVGNMRFHMVLRKTECKLPTNKLHFLKLSGVDESEFKKKSTLHEKQLLEQDEYFRMEEKKGKDSWLVHQDDETDIDISKL